MIRSVATPNLCAGCTAPPLPKRPAAPVQAQDTVTLGGPSAPAFWGATGHATINLEAAHSLPDDMPKFFREGAPNLEALGSQPDRWKFRSLRTLMAANGPDHYLNSELLGDRELPRDRYTYLGMIIDDHLNEPKTRPASVGFLPYGITENFEKLQAEMALYRRETDKSGRDSVMAKQLSQNVLYTAGILGHFVADASQPLHTTVHADGWKEAVEPNPQHFTTERGIHSRFESRYVNAVVQPGDVQKLLHPARAVDGDIQDTAEAFIKDSHKYVSDLYLLDQEGKFNPSKPSEEGTKFVKDRLASGAQMLRDLWYTAWVRSEKLASTSDQEGDADMMMRSPTTLSA